MADNLSINNATIRRIRRRIDRLGGDFTPIGYKVGNAIARHNRKQFTMKGAYYGTPWRPLASATIKDKRLHGFRMAPLVRSGDLKAGVTVVPMSKMIFTATKGIYGTIERVAKWQHYGTRRHGRQHIPPRKIIGTNAAMRTEVIDIIRRHVLR